MYPGAGRSLGERARNSGVRPDPPGSPVPDERFRDAGPGRHCWVRDPPAAPGTQPGLLIEWRQRDGAWQGRVAYTVAGPHGPALVETWVPADRLQPRG